MNTLTITQKSAKKNFLKKIKKVLAFFAGIYYNNTCVEKHSKTQRKRL